MGVCAYARGHNCAPLGDVLDRRFRESMSVCVDQKLKTVRDPEFVEYRAEVMTNRGFADEQPFSNLPVFEAFPDDSNDLSFSLGQVRNSGLIGVCRGVAARESPEDTGNRRPI